MKKNLVMSFILIFVIITSFYGPVFGEELNDLYTKKEEIKTQQDEAVTKLEGVQDQLSQTLQQILDLNNNITNYENEINGLDEEMIQLQNSIAEIEEKLNKAEEDYEKNKRVMDNRLVAMYESGETTYLDVILSSSSISDFISNYYLISLAAQYDIDFLNEIEEQKRSIEENKKQLEEQKKQINEIRENKEKASIILQNTKVMKDSYVAQLTEEERIKQQEIDTYQQQLNEIEAEIMRIAIQNLDSQYIGGVMAWPVPGYTVISSPYGMRVHPITGIYKLHTGTDIRAPMRANFIAANDGVVVKAGMNAAYGNMVIIDHGGGISTLYAHGDEILVQTGQTVKKGDVILKVGSTGYSTGPHAHFEVRINGSPVDPMPYITSLDEENSEENN